MRARNFLTITAFLIFVVALNTSAFAGPPEGKGKGGGKDDDGTSSGGNGFNTPSPMSVSVLLADNAGNAIRGDSYGPYVDEERVNDSPYRMDAHIDGDSGGSYGNFFLLIERDSTVDPNYRTIHLDIESGCIPEAGGCDDQPFGARDFDSIGLTVSATESIAGGFCGLDIGGPSITAPMQLVYADEDFFGTLNPGFVDFFPASKRKSPCYGLTSEVQVLRTAQDSWTVSGDMAACVTWPGGRKFGGVTVMPFEFTVDITPDSALSCN